METLTRDQILQAIQSAKIERSPLVVPELGGTIYVRGMSGTERDKFEEGLRIRRGRRAGQSDLRNFRAALAVKVITDADGVRIMQDGDVDMLGKLPAGVLDRILATCTELSGKAEEEIEEIKNDSASPAASADSSTSSRSN